MDSLRDISRYLFGGGLFLANAGRAVQVGANRIGLLLRWWEATLSLAVVIALLAVVVVLLRISREAGSHSVREVTPREPNPSA